MKYSKTNTTMISTSCTILSISSVVTPTPTAFAPSSKTSLPSCKYNKVIKCDISSIVNTTSNNGRNSGHEKGSTLQCITNRTASIVHPIDGKFNIIYRSSCTQAIMTLSKQ